MNKGKKGRKKLKRNYVFGLFGSKVEKGGYKQKGNVVLKSSGRGG